jgi:hypothetical protein
MSGWELFGILVALLIVGGLLMNMREIIRYFKIRSM